MKTLRMIEQPQHPHTIPIIHTIPVRWEDEEPPVAVAPSCPICGSPCDKRKVGRWSILSLWRCTNDSCDWVQVEG